MVGVYPLEGIKRETCSQLSPVVTPQLGEGPVIMYTLDSSSCQARSDVRSLKWKAVRDIAHGTGLQEGIVLVADESMCFDQAF